MPEKIVKLNCGCGTNRLAGFVNLDKKRGWNFEDGLKDYADKSVSAITISHSLMFVAEETLLSFLQECFRALEVGGVLRITEDDTENPHSDTYKNGWKGAVLLTGPKMMEDNLAKAGFTNIVHTTFSWTNYADNTIMQNFHGGSPRAFVIEAIKI